MSSLEQMYQQVILDHAKSPHGRGLVEAADATTHGQSHQVNPTCGDEVTLRVEIGGAGGAAGSGPAQHTISRVSWEGQGCSISQASLSVLTDLVTGRPVDEAEHLGEVFRELMGSRGKGLDDDAEDELGDATAFTGVSRYPARIKCALLGWAALRDSLVTSGALDGTGTTNVTEPAGAAPSAPGTTEENR
ncbi:Fe-S cluster assembly sulfur transfer protein SufU [Cellulosimicrobium sp. NPDC057127]|uniref:Fe-S cluster assembly sulfur transfer protein SufU n=1 Tax=Cellulosimicrobium sp. NPDC057127 TaxID=3346026 RepID=UPI0036344F7A